ncbi:MAG: hypothetical protein DMG89_01795 [Acidobacteria bacterium]|nr:MAG: hypothetical protein DMG89_01795 [Acidobacteriota bacterium]
MGRGNLTVHSLRIVMLLVIGAFVCVGQTSPNSPTKFDLVLVGTVTQKGESSFREVPRSSKNLVVQVEKVLDKPQSVALKPGDSLTVVAKDPSVFSKGARAMFYLAGWIYGRGVAAREVSHDMLQAGAAAAGGGENRMQEMRKQQRDQELRARIAAADMVVVGTVTEVRPESKPVPTRGRGLSEHNPAWQEAVINVQSNLKGAQGQNQLVVRFPKSMDVAWYLAPRFKEGQSGTFLLKKDVVSGVPKTMLAGTPVQAWTALSPGDVLSGVDADRVRELSVRKP